MRLLQGREEGHSSECLCLFHEGQKDWADYIYESGNGQVLFSDLSQLSVELHKRVNKSEREADQQITAVVLFFPLMDN